MSCSCKFSILLQFYCSMCSAEQIKWLIDWLIDWLIFSPLSWRCWCVLCRWRCADRIWTEHQLRWTAWTMVDNELSSKLAGYRSLRPASSATGTHGITSVNLIPELWDGEWGRSRDGCIRWGWWLSEGKGLFGVNLGRPIVIFIVHTQ